MKRLIQTLAILLLASAPAILLASLPVMAPHKGVTEYAQAKSR